MDDLIKRIDQAIIKRASDKGVRDYMGASGLGEECDRKLWYSYKMPKPVDDPRIHRIFDLGHQLEEYMIKLLKNAGYEMWLLDEEGNQFGFTDGVLAGHVDGIIMLESPSLLEFKTYNTTRFTALKKSGVRLSDPKYYTQCQVYMEKLDLSSCLFFALNKNDCEIHVEIIQREPIEAHWAINRGKEIASVDNILEIPRRYGHISSFKCKMCNYREQCWKVDKLEGEK
jgi:hypothetical protein